MPPKKKDKHEDGPPEEMQGSGTFLYDDGTKYEGEWVKEDQAYLRQGKGKLTMDGGKEWYDGEWKKDVREGQGTIQFASGAKYSGEWKEGKMAGDGEYTFPDGTVYTGNFEENTIHGTGTYKDGEGREWHGSFQHGFGPGLIQHVD